jgi:rubrerythrin
LRRHLPVEIKIQREVYLIDDNNTTHTSIEIMQKALRKEQNPYKFYDLLLQSTVSFVSDLLEELRDAEFHHMKKTIGALEQG